ncbi:hypothetical protein NSQ26_12300 [Bacillus sp. FSL W7-1360]
MDKKTIAGTILMMFLIDHFIGDYFPGYKDYFIGRVVLLIIAVLLVFLYLKKDKEDEAGDRS